MKPLSELPDAAARGVAFVLTDIDDTITTEGRLPAASYAALERLQEAGLKVVPVTGRPGGWCDLIARFWPVDGVVGENGAFWLRHDASAGRLIRRFLVAENERRENRRRLEALAARILAEVPGCALASDQLYREADLAIDFCEDVPPLPEEEIAHIVALFEAAGCTAKVSSIHANGWFGCYDKLTMTRLFLGEALGIDLDADPARFVFVGDSPNDQPMFGFFPASVGVANLRRFLPRLTTPPRWLTAAEGGHGFAELARLLLEARSQA
jgi:HAD superfamily hydrolase (TIGR01484 family)